MTRSASRGRPGPDRCLSEFPVQTLVSCGLSPKACLRMPTGYPLSPSALYCTCVSQSLVLSYVSQSHISKLVSQSYISNLVSWCLFHTLRLSRFVYNHSILWIFFIFIYILFWQWLVKLHIQYEMPHPPVHPHTNPRLCPASPRIAVTNIGWNCWHSR